MRRKNVEAAAFEENPDSSQVAATERLRVAS
jgi:hypothetical protein